MNYYKKRRRQNGRQSRNAVESMEQRMYKATIDDLVNCEPLHSSLDSYANTDILKAFQGLWLDCHYLESDLKNGFLPEVSFKQVF